MKTLHLPCGLLNLLSWVPLFHFAKFFAMNNPNFWYLKPVAWAMACRQYLAYLRDSSALRVTNMTFKSSTCRLPLQLFPATPWWLNFCAKNHMITLSEDNVKLTSTQRFFTTYLAEQSAPRRGLNCSVPVRSALKNAAPQGRSVRVRVREVMPGEEGGQLGNSILNQTQINLKVNP